MRVAIIPGDGIGPEVISSAVRAIEAVSADIEMEEALMGLDAHRRTGSYLPEHTVELLRDVPAALFGAITSPLSYDPTYRSPLLQIRKEFDLYANIRPVKRHHPDIGLVDLDAVIVRENTEGMYTGIERDEGDGVITERKVTTRACQRLVDRALRLCREEGRRKLTCVHKSNVLRRSDGLFRKIFYERAEGQGIEVSDMLVDAAAAALITKPQDLDVIVTLNLYGDILSDEAAALTGGLGFAPSANMGDDLALFEPTHGSAPDIAGKNIANPVAAILSAAMMLRHLGMKDKALRLETAVKDALANGLRTRDAGGRLGTEEFTRAYLEVLGTT